MQTCTGPWHGPPLPLWATAPGPPAPGRGWAWPHASLCPGKDKPGGTGTLWLHTSCCQPGRCAQRQARWGRSRPRGRAHPQRRLWGPQPWAAMTRRRTRATSPRQEPWHPRFPRSWAAGLRCAAARFGLPPLLVASLASLGDPLPPLTRTPALDSGLPNPFEILYSKCE